MEDFLMLDNLKKELMLDDIFSKIPGKYNIPVKLPPGFQGKSGPTALAMISSSLQKILKKFTLINFSNYIMKDQPGQ